MMRWIAAAAAALLLGAASAQAQPQPPAPFDAAARKAAVEKVATALRDRYVYPDVGAKAAETIEGQLAAGAYDQLADRQAFAQRLTEDLATIAHDKHLRVMTPGGPPPAGRGPPPHSEGGVVRADRLPGGYGYLEVSAFPRHVMFKAPVDKAMAALADTKGLIVDLRRNGGGDPQSVGYLVSFFFADGQRVHINDLIWRNPNTATYRTDESWTVPTPTKYLGKPVYLLTGPFTFSGGEEFAYDLQTLKRATLVGEVTGGGANPGGTIEIGEGMVVFVPGGRAQNPITHTSWEGKGVTPDVATPRDQALKVALQKLGQTVETADIESLSQARLFQARTTAQPGAETALRLSIAGLASGAPPYDAMAPGLAETIRAQLPRLHATFEKLGALKSVTFKEVDQLGGSVYDVTFANGATRWVVMLGDDGKVQTAFFRPL
jgi:hypothetical protein